MSSWSAQPPCSPTANSLPCPARPRQRVRQCQGPSQPRVCRGILPEVQVEAISSLDRAPQPEVTSLNLTCTRPSCFHEPGPVGWRRNLTLPGSFFLFLFFVGFFVFGFGFFARIFNGGPKPMPPHGGPVLSQPPHSTNMGSQSMGGGVPWIFFPTK